MSSTIQVELAAREFRPSWSPDTAVVDALTAVLERDGIVRLPTLVSTTELGSMQKAFEMRLKRMRWNNLEGYQKTEPYRELIEDVLLIDQGFVDLALHPTVKAVLDRYLGSDYELTEAKGWRSLPTIRDFHGWHGDAWYDQQIVKHIPREVKLAMYLTDVESGAFNYIKGTHRNEHPRLVKNDEIGNASESQIEALTGPAGTAFLFDTSGIHRQSVPILESRQAIFFNYHDPNVPLQPEDVDYYRYHPLLLNAAFLGGLSREDERILGFGNKTNFIPHFERQNRSLLFNAFSHAFHCQLRARDLKNRVALRWKRLKRIVRR
jgi:hypothetical protein